MITKILIGDILKSNAQTLINTVNCVGIMGKGIALAFKNIYPEMFKDYKDKCEKNVVVLGKPYIYKGLFPPWIINFPTKQNWRSISQIHDIQNGLLYLVDHYKEWELESLAVPPLGCGNGKLDWRDVGPIIFQTLDKIDMPVYMYAPHGTPKKYLKRDFLSQSIKNGNGQFFPHSSRLLNPAWLALVEILYQIEKHPYHQPIGRTIFNKVGYFATEQSLPTNFKFREGSYGPFSPDIKRAITILANNGLIIEEQKGQMYKINVGPNYENVREKRQKEIEKYNEIIKKTADLFARINTEQAEIATTIFHSFKQIKSNKSEVTECDVLEYVMEWKKRRRPPYEKERIATAIRSLAILKWLSVKYSEDLPVYEEI